MTMSKMKKFVNQVMNKWVCNSAPPQYTIKHMTDGTQTTTCVLIAQDPNVYIHMQKLLNLVYIKTKGAIVKTSF